jgi:hypothetical protein
MKRTVQMVKAGTPSSSQPSKFKGFRGTGARHPLTGTRREWRHDEPLIYAKGSKDNPRSVRHEAPDVDRFPYTQHLLALMTAERFGVPLGQFGHFVKQAFLRFAFGR